MESVSLVLAMIAAVIGSSLMGRVLPAAIPLPLVQIGLGVVISAGFNGGVKLDPELFFLLFLPPLLFLDGWRTPKEGLWREKGGIFQLAFGLVLLTVLGLGYIVHWMIPAMPLAVAFALAAIVSPTDPIAVSGLANHLSLPKPLVSVLEGESLFNDASGLVSFQVAVTAAITGTFSLYDATLDFAWDFVGGVACGIFTTYGIFVFRDWFVRRFGEEPSTEVLLSLLTPFMAYFLSETVLASGILAAVSAGLTMTYVELSGHATAATRMYRRTMWDVVQFVLKGAMFVLLGEQLPHLFRRAVHVVAQTGHASPLWLLGYAVVICLVLGLFRFVWVYIALRLSARSAHRRGVEFPDVTLSMMGVLAAGGVRGAVTLAGVLTLPLVLENGQAFPARDLTILLAATVIITSLVLASILLPVFARQIQVPSSQRREEQTQLAIREAQGAVELAVRKLFEHRSGEITDPALREVLERVVDRVLADARDVSSVSQLGLPNRLARREQRLEQEFKLCAIRAAREAIQRLARHHAISDELARDMIRRLDLEEVRMG